MTRADVRTFAWLVPLSLMLTFWWLFTANPCLGTEIANQWRARNPVAVEITSQKPQSPDTIEIDNPYGIEACDYFPDAKDHLRTIAILFAVVVSIGFLCAWNFMQRAGQRAAAIAFCMLCLVGVFGELVYLPHELSYYERFGYGPMIEMSLLVLLYALGAGATAWAAAALTLRWRPRG